MQFFRSIAFATLAFAATTISAPMNAQGNGEAPEGETVTSSLPCQADEYRAFDFWIGEWEVRDPQGELKGLNSIQPINGGCGLIERYSVNGELFGQSYNFYDPVREIWTQLWLSPGLIIRLEGEIGEPGTLTMSGTSTYTEHLQSRAFTGRWTLQEDGSVKQEFWEQDPETGDWSNWFTGIYTRRTEIDDAE